MLFLSKAFALNKIASCLWALFRARHQSRNAIPHTTVNSTRYFLASSLSAAKDGHHVLPDKADRPKEES